MTTTAKTTCVTPLRTALLALALVAGSAGTALAQDNAPSGGHSGGASTSSGNQVGSETNPSANTGR